MSNNNALNGAKARIVTLNKTIEVIERENTLLRHRHVIADRARDTLNNQIQELVRARDAQDVRTIRLTAENKSLRTKVEKAYTFVACLAILLVITIGTVTGGLFA